MVEIQNNLGIHHLVSTLKLLLLLLKDKILPLALINQYCSSKNAISYLLRLNTIPQQRTLIFNIIPNNQGKRKVYKNKKPQKFLRVMRVISGTRQHKSHKRNLYVLF